jgi:hypothetical protein
VYRKSCKAETSSSTGRYTLFCEKPEGHIGAHGAFLSRDDDPVWWDNDGYKVPSEMFAPAPPPSVQEDIPLSVVSDLAKDVQRLSEELAAEKERSQRRMEERDAALAEKWRLEHQADMWREEVMISEGARDIMFDNLTETQRRCTQLIDELRALKRART